MSSDSTLKLRGEAALCNTYANEIQENKAHKENWLLKVPQGNDHYWKQVYRNLIFLHLYTSKNATISISVKNLKQRVEGAHRNTCANEILVNKSNRCIWFLKPRRYNENYWSNNQTEILTISLNSYKFLHKPKQVRTAIAVNSHYI